MLLDFLFNIKWIKSLDRYSSFRTGVRLEDEAFTSFLALVSSLLLAQAEVRVVEGLRFLLFAHIVNPNWILLSNVLGNSLKFHIQWLS